jgi:photoactive yellow protein
MVQGLASQLDELYGAQAEEERRSETGEFNQANLDTFEQLQALLEREEKLQRELGVSDPQAVIVMVQGLADQLDELYAARERLSKVNLDDADGVVEMVSSMQQQLEALYAGQEILSEHGIHSVEHAVAMIESMETQLEDLYREKRALMDQGLDDPAEAAERMQMLEEQLEALRREKSGLLERRQDLQREKESYASTVDTLKDQLGTADASTITKLIASMEEQLVDLYREREDDGAYRPGGPDPTPQLLDEATIERLDAMDTGALDALDVGAACLDDDGRVQRLNREAVALLPGLDDDADPASFEGQHFFFELAPGANNSLFRGRFRQGVESGTLDARFVYTLISRASRPLNLAVQLVRSPAHGTNWILFRRA